MRKTLEELNAQYVPNNGSTNFTNSTCRKRLLNRYIGEGKWEYIYEGRRVIAVEIVEPVTEVVEEVNEVQSEIDLCYTSIKSHEDEIERLKARIKELEELRDSRPCDSVKDVFKGINFRKYSWRKQIEDNYIEITKRYKNNKHLQGIEKEYEKVMNRFIIQASKHMNSFYRYGSYANPHSCDFDAFDRSNWDSWYSTIYDNQKECEKYSWVKYRSCEDYRHRFTIYTKGIDEVISGAEKLVNMFTGFEDNEEYKRMASLVNNMREYKRKAAECNSKSESMFNEFCKGYDSYASRKTKREKDEFENFWDQFNYYGGWSKFTGSSSGSTQSKKYFNGCTTARELKKRYREWAHKLHPDHGGNQDEFIAMKNEFDRLMKHAA